MAQAIRTDCKNYCAVGSARVDLGGSQLPAVHFHKFSMFRAKKRIFTTLNLQKSHFFDSSRNSRAARHLPCASRKQPTRCDITPLKKVCSIVNPTTRFRRLHKNISDPAIRNFWAAAIGIKRGTIRRRLAQNDVPNRKIACKITFPATSPPYFAMLYS